MAASTSMPLLPRVVFCILEPISLVAGLLTAWFDTDNFVTDQYFPLRFPLPHTPSSTILAYQLGNLYGLFALVGLAILNFSSEEFVVKAYIACLAIGDIGHIVPTLLILGKDATDMSNWNLMAWGNIAATVFLFVTRIAWLLGGFGAPFQSKKGKRQ
ncbi:hypothetical protein MMC10_009671 [Thelotrema lepadinum]|nr:hypothetical protein [Thelotrema lepadinum]